MLPPDRQPALDPGKDAAQQDAGKPRRPRL
jgi:hypothetical protein